MGGAFQRTAPQHTSGPLQGVDQGMEEVGRRHRPDRGVKSLGKEGLEGGVDRKRVDDSGLGVVRATSGNRKWKSGSGGDRGGKVSSRSNRRRTKEHSGTG